MARDLLSICVLTQLCRTAPALLAAALDARLAAREREQQEMVMPEYKYLIVGAGMTADAAVQGIRQVDREGSIGLIGSEPKPPYNRPPLTKGLWKGKPEESIWRSAAADSATLHLGHKAVNLDAANRRVRDGQGTVYQYQKLLLATGGTPRRLATDCPGVIYFRTFEDYKRLRELAGERQQFAVVGGGFIGSEIAAALAMNGRRVVMVLPERGIGARMFPSDLATFLNDYYRSKGVEVHSWKRVAGVEARGDRFALKLVSPGGQGEDEILVDAVVAGLGIEPNVELARQAGLEVGRGIRVDRALRTSRPDIYAAGDAAEFWNPALEAYLRVEHEDNANTMGEMAGRSMAGKTASYDYLPFFYSDLFDLGYEAVGEVDSRLETVSDWKEPFREGVIYYVRNGRVRGVLLWNVWERVDAARQLISEAGPFEPADLKGRLTKLHEHA
jgi:3-phenylpropionate/trans-cinnamate dioxygenase ferredoxin reductase subunit